MALIQQHANQRKQRHGISSISSVSGMAAA